MNGHLQFAPDLAGGDGFDAAFFPELVQTEAHNFWFRARNALIVWAVQTYFKQARSLFEVGCGTGFVLRGLREAFPGLRLAGSDIFSDAVEIARTRVQDAELYQMDARRIPFVAEFDVAAAFDVLEHVEDDEQVIAQLHQAVRPGGGVLIAVPQHRWLWSAMDDVSHHKRRYERRELICKLKRHGLAPLRITSFTALLLPPMLLSRARQRRCSSEYDAFAELRLGRTLNSVFERTLDLERLLIARGISFPVGGSLFAVCRRD